MEDNSGKDLANKTHVNVQEESELKYWADKFNVSKAAVVRAVEMVGVQAKDVNEFLNGRVA